MAENTVKDLVYTPWSTPGGSGVYGNKSSPHESNIVDFSEKPKDATRSGDEAAAGYIDVEEDAQDEVPNSAFLSKLREAAAELPEAGRASWLENAVQTAAELCNPQPVQSPKPAPRLKWGQDNKPYENPAVFAWRAYQAEALAGMLHRGVILRNDDSLYRALRYWLESNPMPEGIDIPLKSKWNTRQIKAGKAERGKIVPPPRTTEQRLYEVARDRIRKGHPVQPTF